MLPMNDWLNHSGDEIQDNCPAQRLQGSNDDHMWYQHDIYYLPPVGWQDGHATAWLMVELTGAAGAQDHLLCPLTDAPTAAAINTVFQYFIIK